MRISKKHGKCQAQWLSGAGDGSLPLRSEEEPVEHPGLVSFRMDWLSRGSMHDTGCLGLVHWDDLEGWCGEGVPSKRLPDWASLELSPSVESCGCGLGPSPVRLG